MKIIFAGTPQFAEVILESLIHSSHQIVAVYTQPDRPAGRGLKLTSSPVKQLAAMYQLPIYQPASLKDEYEQSQLAAFQADVMLVVAYGLLLPAAVLSIPREGCINVHPSLLPRWRGAAPIQRTVFAGDKKTGVTIMQMDPGLDTGPILLQRDYILTPQETSQSLHDQLATLSAKTVLEALDLLEKNELKPLPQDNTHATYAQKLSKEEALIDWMREAHELAREVRAFNPWPVAYTSWQEKSLRIWEAMPVLMTKTFPPRTIVYANHDGVDIATSNGALRLLQVQLPGSKVMSINDFYNAHHDMLKVGEKFI